MMINEIRKQINETRSKLDKMLENETDKNEVLKVSMQLDELISRYISLRAD